MIGRYLPDGRFPTQKTPVSTCNQLKHTFREPILLTYTKYEKLNTLQSLYMLSFNHALFTIDSFSVLHFRKYL